MTCESKIIGRRYNPIAPHGDDSAVAHNSMENNLFNSVYNPDVLSCIANLSNDEVFTPPELANRIIDMLPQELFENPDTTFLDPCCKSGVFLREIAKRLIKGLERQMPDLEKRLEHIFSKQLYGIAITELTSLLARRSVYCSKFPSSPWSAYQFPEDKPQGNIIYQRIQHTWQNGKCIHCGASQSEYDRDQELETYAYQFIHNLDVKKLFNMKFDVIIGNPPYQMSDGGSGTGISALPLYDKFIEQALKLNPRYLTMIIPARWYAGGRGLSDFRNKMLNNSHLKILVDYPKSRDCFEGVDIAGGVCYFLYDNLYSGNCHVTNCIGHERNTIERCLNEFPILIRYNRAVEIIRKVKIEKVFLSDTGFTSNPFGFRSFVRGSKKKDVVNNIALMTSDGVNYVSEYQIEKNKGEVGKYKVCFGKINPDRGGVNGNTVNYNVINKPFITQPNEIISETYLLIKTFDNIDYSNNCMSYLKTKFTRFLILMSMSSMNITNSNLMFVPEQDFSKPWTDEELYAKYGLTEEEIAFIESMIRPME